MMGGPPNRHVLLPLVEYREREEGNWRLPSSFSAGMLTGIDGAACSNNNNNKRRRSSSLFTVFFPSFSLYLSLLFFFFHLLMNLHACPRHQTVPNRHEAPRFSKEMTEMMC